MKAWTSPISSVVLIPSGTPLQVIAAAAMAVWEVSVTTASVGLHLLSAAIVTACTSCSPTPMAESVRRAAAIGRRVNLSVASKNQNKF